MKQTLSSQEYNEMFRNASNLFNEEMIKRDLIINNMSKKLMIINYTNEFIENKLASLNGTSNINGKLVTFKHDLGGSYNEYGYTIHPKFKKEPIDIFNLKLTSGNTMFRNSLTCKVNEESNHIYSEDYINFLMADNAIEKKIVFQKF